MKTMLLQERDSIIEQIDLKPDKRFITNIEKNHLTQYLSRQNGLLDKVKLILFVILLLTIFLVTWFTFYNHSTRKRVKKLLNDFKDEKVNEHQELLRRIEAYEEQIRCNSARIEETDIKLKQLESLKATLNKHVLMMRKLIKLANSKSENPEYVKRKALNEILSDNISTDMFWKEMELFTDESYHGFVTEMRGKHKNLDEQEIRFLILLCCDFSYADIATIMGYSKDFISVKRSRIIKKLAISIPFDFFLASYKA